MPTEPAPATWTTTQTRAQYAAIARLRWNILQNGFRRKGGTGELIARILVYPVLAGFAIVPMVGGFFGAFFMTSKGHLDWIVYLLWGTFVLCQLLNIQLGQPGSTFDPTQLIRFPLRLTGYVTIRLFFGLLSPANIIGTLVCFCIAIGVLSASPSLWLAALCALAVFATANVLFSRMVFAWVDRWLSTRRAREIFSGIVFVFVLGIQYLNFTFNPAYNHNKITRISPERLALAQSIYHHVTPYLTYLPPELTTRSLLAASLQEPAHTALLIFGCALYAGAFLAVFALRMRSEFRGENLSDAASVSAPSRKTVSPAIRKLSPATAIPANQERAAATAAFSSGSIFGLTPPVTAQFGKELLYVRRNQGVLYALVLPLAIAMFLCLRWSTRGAAHWVFPAAVAYTMLGVTTLSFNSWGLEGTGSQFYFLSPVRIRDIMLGKNLVNFSLAALEVFAMLAVIIYSGNLPPLAIILAVLLWAAAALLVSSAVGNRRSLDSPKKMSLTGASRRQTSQLSGLIALGVMLLITGVGAALFIPLVFLNLEWVLLPAFALLAAAALWFYLRSLGSIDRFALDHREELFTELCKAD